MITRAKLVEQLREHQIRSAQSYSAALAVFSPNPHIASSGQGVWFMYAAVSCALANMNYISSSFPTQGSSMDRTWLKAVDEMERRLLTPSTMASELQNKYDEDKSKKGHFSYHFAP